ncbi:MAG: cytochrome c [Methylocystis sp.]|nr:cytochrome c [Methylocystis sp.]
MKYLIAAALLLQAGWGAALADENGEIPDIIAQCAACHGVDGIAKSADVPHLAGQQEMYLLNQLKAFKTGKRPHKEMRYMSRQLSDAEIAEIAHLYAHMPR